MRREVPRVQRHSTALNDNSMLFSERMKRRKAFCGGGVAQSRRFSIYYKHSLHRVKERYTFRDKNDPESKWHCCEFWQRTLHSKWNAREFAQKHGCVVPTLYWFGRNVNSLPFKSLPKYYVIKPNFGFSRRGVYVMAEEIELFRQSTYNKAQLREELRRVTGGLLGQPILVEEFITDDREYCLRSTDVTYSTKRSPQLRSSIEQPTNKTQGGGTTPSIGKYSMAR